MSLIAGHLVGRASELASLDEALTELDRGQPVAVAVLGEPGIGKTRLLAELAARADEDGRLVLAGSASELEHDLPFSLFVDALDEYLRGLDSDFLASLAAEVRAELAQVFPSLAGLEAGGRVAVQHERYRTHRAVRDLLEHLAEARTLLLVLDDLHWTDSASIELLGALLRRPPASVLIALGLRPQQMPEGLDVILDRAHRLAALTRVELDALSPVEARELLGDALGDAEATVLYRECGGNPFYLEQLARALYRPSGTGPGGDEGQPGDVEVPRIVVASLREELSLLSDSERMILEGAAVAGDPFEPELAAAAAARSEEEAMEAIDVLLQRDLVRVTDMPRRFRFRHPLVRRAVYEAAAAGWRLGAHRRCADALVERGAAVAERAHHVERSARQGDLEAVAVLREAGEAALRLAPGSAARWYGDALRLLPETSDDRERIELLRSRAGALAAAGRFTEAHDDLVVALELVPGTPGVSYAEVTRACAAVESVLGLHAQARERLAGALERFGNLDAPEAIAMVIELAMNGFWRADFADMHQAARRAVDAARSLGSEALIGASLAVLALADSMMGYAERSEEALAEAARLVDSLEDHEVSPRLDAVAWLAGAELYLDRYREADRHAYRALSVGRATGQGELIPVLVQILGRVWCVRGKLAEAAELLDGGIEAARLLGNTQTLVWNLFNRSVAALAAGDMEVASATAQESMDLCHELGRGFHSAWAAVRLAGVLLETGHPDDAIQLLLDCCGGERMELIPGSWRAYCLDLLARSWLARERAGEASSAAAVAREWAAAVQTPLASAWAERAAAAVDLHAGDAGSAAERALASSAMADEVGAPIEAALSRVLAGRALAEAGRLEDGVEQLRLAADQLEGCGALRYRDLAERELRRLGQHIYRRTRPGRTDGLGVDTLTERELQVARLVADRRTNREIAEELFISKKTVETHLRNIFNKVGVSSRVQLARTVERADRGTD